MNLPSWPNDEGLAKVWRARGLRGQVAYEDAAVRRVLTRFGLRSVIREIAYEAKDRLGEAFCTFAAAEERIHGFPLRLRVGNVRALRRLTVPDLFDRFTKTPLYSAFRDLFTAEGIDPAEEPVGMVFAWAAETTFAGREGKEVRRGIKGGRFMVMHTLSTPASAERGDATRLVRRCQDYELTIQTLDGLLAELDGWQEC